MAALGAVTSALALLATDIGSVSGAVLLVTVAIKVGFWYRRSL
ncbi:major capsid protein [Cupriavidus necator]